MRGRLCAGGVLVVGVGSGWRSDFWSGGRMNECATNVPFAILAVARHLEATNNSGTRFAGGVMHQYRWIRKAKYKYFRDGILYYSRGHGWRVRKKPHWKAVFNLRFNQWFDEAGFPVEVDADAPLGVPTKAAGAD